MTPPSITDPPQALPLSHVAPPRFADRLIFGTVNVFVYVRHWRTVRRFRKRVGYCPDVARPRRYNEKVLWRKLFDRNPLFVTFTDKLANKGYLARCCPDLPTAEVLWVGNDAAMIPADVRARPIVIKASHGCDFSYLLGPGDADRSVPVARLNGWLRRNVGRRNLEWAYALADRKLYAEALIVPAPDEHLVDISVHAANGIPICIEAITGNKTANLCKGYFRIDGRRWPEIERKRGDPSARMPLPDDFRLPPSYVEALAHARRLGAGVDYARFDFLAASGVLYGGEITVYPASGLTRHAEFLAYNAVVSDHWDLSVSWFFASRHRGLRGLYAGALRRFLGKGETSA
jgi:hypothetical protein